MELIQWLDSNQLAVTGKDVTEAPADTWRRGGDDAAPMDSLLKLQARRKLGKGKEARNEEKGDEKRPTQAILQPEKEEKESHWKTQRWMSQRQVGDRASVTTDLVKNNRT